MRYILALVPPKQYQSAYIQAAQFFSPINDGYLLNDKRSMPHVTLCSFQCDEERKLQEIDSNMQNWPRDCPIRLLGLLFKKGKTPANHYSVSLSVARDPSILKLHHLAFHLLQALKVTVLNPSQDLYLPHLTLAGIRWVPSEILNVPAILDDLISMPTVPFHLVLGRGDDIGQYLDTLSEKSSSSGSIMGWQYVKK